MPEPKNVIRETDDDAIRLARSLLATARHGALAVTVSDSGFPGASRVALATDCDGTPLILVSSLSWHTAALTTDSRCSLLVGEPGNGDPLAHPRVTVFARAKRVEPGTAESERARRRYLARQPKASLYADFGDFSFFRLEIESAKLNGGFGKAYELTLDDLALRGDVFGVAEMEESAVAHMNEDHGDTIALYAEVLGKAGPGKWHIATLDSEGMDLVDRDRTCRVWYPAPLSSGTEMRRVLAEMAAKARSEAGIGK
ncbi:HugZ family protein [Oricola cellulosilytica]|uniref:HugZ family protein n=1 Tax=Oricola cellulosilytica TaxID=1429082 RepID=A0A4R0PD12_9HYPH|nr:DUF2470 domain-containing protein [Oricola cellulosilytica]TCD15370.1 HugZ family protein [Oricola cellulosilytica]